MSKFLMWSGIVIVTLAVAVLWGYSFKLRLDAIEWNKTAEANLTKDAKKNWDQAFEEQKAKEEKNKITNQISEILKQVILTTTTLTTTKE